MRDTPSDEELDRLILQRLMRSGTVDYTQLTREVITAIGDEVLVPFGDCYQLSVTPEEFWDVAAKHLTTGVQNPLNPDLWGKDYARLR